MKLSKAEIHLILLGSDSYSSNSEFHASESAIVAGVSLSLPGPARLRIKVKGSASRFVADRRCSKHGLIALYFHPVAAGFQLTFSRRNVPSERYSEWDRVSDPRCEGRQTKQ